MESCKFIVILLNVKQAALWYRKTAGQGDEADQKNPTKRGINWKIT
jgi:hypothetical protein